MILPAWESVNIYTLLKSKQTYVRSFQTSKSSVHSSVRSIYMFEHSVYTLLKSKQTYV